MQRIGGVLAAICACCAASLAILAHIPELDASLRAFLVGLLVLIIVASAVGCSLLD